MMLVKDQRLSPLLIGLFLLTLLRPACLHAGDQRTPALLMGGSCEHPPVHRFLPGSKRTLLFPAMVGKHGEVTPLHSPPCGWPSFLSLFPNWGGFLKQIRERSTLQLATLNPLLIRDRRQVIQMAIITTEDPATASCILTPGFLQRFSALFGPELIVSIPARNKIYVFPKLANRIGDAREMIRDDYLISPMPVSTELFELSKKGIRAIGDCDPTH